jgi:A/G-specific adenine glycosylase
MTREDHRSRVGKSRFAEDLLRWHADNRRSFPWREDPDPYLVFLAEVFLQRTPAERVASLLESFVLKYPSPRILASADPETLERELTPLGLTKRTKWLVAAATTIAEQFDGIVPDEVDELLKLPGVGPYTAAAVASFAYGKDVPAVDVNVVRVVSRAFSVEPSTRAKRLRAVTEVLDETIPLGRGPFLNQALLDLAASVCKRRPRCAVCPVRESCDYCGRQLED